MFVRRLIGVSTSPLVGSIYNMGVWDKVATAWVNVETRRTLDREEAAHRRYKETGRSLENGECIGDPHIVVDRCMVFLCILHCCMAIGRLQVAFIETRLVDLPKENTDAVQRVLYRARTGVKLGATGAPVTGRRPVRCSSRGRNLVRCWTTSKRMVNGKPS